MIVFSVMCCTVVAMAMLVIAPLFPQLYNTNPASRELAKYFIMVTAVFMPQQAFLHAAYFTLRSGGKRLLPSSLTVCLSAVSVFRLPIF